MGGHNGNSAQSSSEVFDIATQRWSALPKMASQRYYHGVCVHQGKIYAIGGHTGIRGTNTCECYDIATRAWHELGSMAMSRYATL